MKGLVVQDREDVRCHLVEFLAVGGLGLVDALSFRGAGVEVPLKFRLLVQPAHLRLVFLQAFQLLRMMQPGRLQFGAESLELRPAQNAIAGRIEDRRVQQIGLAERTEKGLVFLVVGGEHDQGGPTIANGWGKESGKRGIDLFEPDRGPARQFVRPG